MEARTPEGPLTPEQVAQYHRDGYLVVEGLFSPDEVERFVAYESEAKPEGWNEDLRRHTHDDLWDASARNPRITAILRQLLGAEPRTVQSMYLEKKPAAEGAAVGGQGIALHQDLHYLPTDTGRLIACWCAMGDTDAENGGLCVVPGSQADGLYRTHKNADTEEHDAWEFEYGMRDRDGKEWTERMYSFEIEGLDHDRVVRLDVPAGAGVFFDGLTIHGSFANRSPTRHRRALAFHYVPEGTWVYRTDVQDTVPAT